MKNWIVYTVANAILRQWNEEEKKLFKFYKIYNDSTSVMQKSVTVFSAQKKERNAMPRQYT